MRDTAEYHFLPVDRYPVSASFLSDRGPTRSTNEDSAAVVIPAEKGLLERKGILVLVADGMGGREGGETASNLASRHVPETYYDSSGTADESLRAAFQKANEAIFQESRRDPRLSGMGTTCTAVAVVNGLAFAAHVGDSRIYLVRRGGAYRMTEDHSAPMRLVNRGIITLAEAAYHEDRNVILRAMGTRAEIEAAQWKEPFPLLPGDRLVLCSDGLHGTISDGEIAQLAAGSVDPAAACAALIELATRRECGDNVTAAVLYLGDSGAGMTGRTIGNYRITAKLGEGAMGVVYRAVDLMVEREVAIKSLKVDASPETLEQFRTEAVALARLNHPSIAQLYTFFREGDECYMVMEYIPGETLEERLHRAGPLPWPEAVQFARLVLEGLQHAHDQGILHRDIKPGNIMLPTPGGAKIMDFGIARMMGAAREATEGRVVGTLGYLAPERIQGSPAVPASDQYSAAVTLYEMLTGKLPISGALVAQVREDPTPLAQHGVVLPEALEAALMKALDKDPGARHTEAMAFSAALESDAPRLRRNRILPLIGAGVAILAALAFFTFRPRAEDPWRPTPPLPAVATPPTKPLPDFSATPMPYRPALAGVQSIYVEKRTDGLDEIIAAEIAAKFGSRIKLEKSPGDADALLSLEALTARTTGAVIWRFELGGQKPDAHAAERLATQLRAAIPDNQPVSVR